MNSVFQTLQLWGLAILQLGIEQMSPIKNEIELNIFFLCYKMNYEALFGFGSLIVHACYIMNRAKSKCNSQISKMCMKLGRKTCVNQKKTVKHTIW